MCTKIEIWERIMKEAAEAGFIRFAYAGVALLSLEEIKEAKE